ncbi:hypothetical protein Acr_22g0002270 [Actinidia rufa]|uniref:Uncharacterized protein n=1 Tax=Actinidia rufa TaxID=165716 RepID=A0A7J0GJ41_9ERIC|nr:hypothetical protein Acr_22g0002270 [Actinidia rufa]
MWVTKSVALGDGCGWLRWMVVGLGGVGCSILVLTWVVPMLMLEGTVVRIGEGVDVCGGSRQSLSSHIELSPDPIHHNQALLSPSGLAIDQSHALILPCDSLSSFDFCSISDCYLLLAAFLCDGESGLRSLSSLLDPMSFVANSLHGRIMTSAVVSTVLGSATMSSVALSPSILLYFSYLQWSFRALSPLLDLIMDDFPRDNRGFGRGSHDLRGGGRWASDMYSLWPG